MTVQATPCFSLGVMLAVIAAGLALSPTAHAQRVTTLWNFCSESGCADGKFPTAGLSEDTQGNLWGTTSDGGAHGAGTLFTITLSGTLTTVYNFCALSECADGADPNTGLTLGFNGDMYGTTVLGGAYASADPRADSGTAFSISSAAGLTTLGSFCFLTGCPAGAAPSTGSIPAAPLVEAPGGILYGVTSNGGLYAYPTENSGFNGGTVFEITPNGQQNTIYNFCAQSDCADGDGPGALMLGDDGNLYGTTFEGGAHDLGTVFKITPSGMLTTLYSFCALSDCADGAYPNALVQGADGVLYGTTDYGCGTIFKITTTGALTPVYTFQGGSNCGPSGPLVRATDGNLYGTTQEGGPYYGGSIYRITPSGKLTSLAYFCSFGGCAPTLPAGYRPTGLMQATNGDFYGVTEMLGGYDQGTIFQLSLGLAPFVKTLPAFGEVGSAITIFGTDLAGATSVTFNGTAATFHVVSASSISARVPSGATTGIVQVTIPGGKLSSNGEFHVTR